MTAELEPKLEAFVLDVANRATTGGSTDLAVLLPLVYEDLRGLAAYLLRGERDLPTLGPTVLAHEAFLRLAAQDRSDLRSRAQLVSLASTMMRRILVDGARRRGAIKRGGVGAEKVALSDSLPARDPVPDLVELGRALERLEAFDERKARVVELLYFAGLTLPEAAGVLEVSSRTVQRDWDFARAWLWSELVDEDGS